MDETGESVSPPMPPAKTGFWTGVALVVLVAVILTAAVLAGLFAPPVRMALSEVSGDGQSGANDTALPEPFVVLVTDEFGNPAENVRVNWTLAASPGLVGGFLSNNSTTTDGDGLARTTLVLGHGTGVGTYTVTAFLAANPTARVTFTATKTP